MINLKEKVLGEINALRYYLVKQNASWSECFSEIYSDDIKYAGIVDLCGILYHKYGFLYNFNNTNYLKNEVFEPLEKVKLSYNNFGDIHEYECHIGKITLNTKSKQASRDFVFCSNGDIMFRKSDLRKITSKHSRKISYAFNYNVLATGLNFKFEINDDIIHVSLNGNLLSIKYSNYEIIHDLDSNFRTIKISKRENGATIGFQALINNEQMLEAGALVINTHKGNGKINGTYRFDVSHKRAVRAEFISRKGNKINLATMPNLMCKANLLLPSKSSEENTIISNFALNTQQVLRRNLSQKISAFDPNDFSIGNISNIEESTIDFLRTIKGEIPLPNLVKKVERLINFYTCGPKPRINGPKTLNLEKKTI